jgi:hypothetical protein
MSSLVPDLAIAVSALSQDRKLLGAKMETNQLLKKRFKQAENALRASE